MVLQIRNGLEANFEMLYENTFDSCDVTRTHFLKLTAWCIIKSSNQKSVRVSTSHGASVVKKKSSFILNTHSYTIADDHLDCFIRRNEQIAM